MLQYEELQYVIKPFLEIGMFYPKSGDMENITVANIYISEREVLDDVVTFINYMPIKNLVDISYSNYTDSKGFYIIFIELTNSKETFDDIIRIMYEMMAVTNIEKWGVRIYKNKEREYTFEEVKNYFK